MAVVTKEYVESLPEIYRAFSPRSRRSSPRGRPGRARLPDVVCEVEGEAEAGVVLVLVEFRLRILVPGISPL